MAGFHKFHVRLFRDSFNTPWGFRLQGGKDLNQALSVQRVFSNTPAEGELQRGDVIISIGDRNGDELTHKQAKDLIEGGGGQINLVLTRPPPGRHGAKGQAPAAPTFRTPAPVAPRTNPPKAMPYHGGGAQTAGHKPKKLNISNLGGGGPDFGSDYSRPYTTAPPMQTSRPSTRPVGGQMLNKVQESLDSIIYSPRTPEGYQAPPFQYQPAQPPPFQPNMTMTGYSPQQQAPAQQGGYRPTYEAVDSGQYSEEQEDFVPVWERRKTFQDKRPATYKVRSTPIPKVPRPGGSHPETQTFGTDYSQYKGQPQIATWTPQQAPPQQYSQPSQPIQYSQPSQPIQYSQPSQPSQPNKPIQSEPPVYPLEAETRSPWRETLKSTGVKPWDVDLDYTAQQPTPSTQAPPSAKPGKEGDRDWNASAVYRMIHSEPTRPGQAPPAQRAPAPPPQTGHKPVAAPAYQPQQYNQPQQQYNSPQPQYNSPQPQYNSQGFEDELGVSDF